MGGLHADLIRAKGRAGDRSRRPVHAPKRGASKVLVSRVSCLVSLEHVKHAGTPDVKCEEKLNNYKF